MQLTTIYIQKTRCATSSGERLCDLTWRDVLVLWFADGFWAESGDEQVSADSFEASFPMRDRLVVE